MSQVNDKRYAELCQAAYIDEPTWVGVGINANIHALLYDVSGLRVICFRGSKELLDWVLDVFAVPALMLDRQLGANLHMGMLHTGFLVGAMSIFRQMADAVDDRPYALCGHSLGGALALITAGLLKGCNENAPLEIVTFGAPRAGMSLLSEYLHDIPVRQYRFGADPVPLVPTHPYCHVREPLLQIGQPVQSRDLFENHHIQHYIDAIAGLDQPLKA